MSPPPRPAELSPWASALAGALAAVLANAAVYPLDTVKTRLQAADADEVSDQRRPLELEAHASSTDSGLKGKDIDMSPLSDEKSSVDRKVAAGSGTRRPAAGLVGSLGRILTEEGVGGFYRGFLANMLNTFSMQYAYFFFYSLVRSLYLARQRRRLQRAGGPVAAIGTAAELALGALAGALAQVFTIPVAVIATRQQLAQPSDGPARSLLEVAREIVDEDGPSGLWRGLRPGLVLTVNPALTYGLSSRLKEVLLACRQGGVLPAKLTALESFVLGAFCKSIATVVTYPYIMAKVRLQARRFPLAAADVDETESTLAPRPGEDASDAGQTSYAAVAARAVQKVEGRPASVTGKQIRSAGASPASDGAVDVLSRIYASKGFTGLYQGMGAQIFKAVLTQGILFTVKDQVESYALILLLLLGRSRKAAAVAAAAVENVVEPLVDGGKRLAQAGEQLAQHAPALPSSPSAAVEAAVSVAKGAAVSIEEHLPNASEGLRLAEKAALSVGRDVVQKLAVDAVAGAIQK